MKELMIGLGAAAAITFFAGIASAAPTPPVPPVAPTPRPQPTFPPTKICPGGIVVPVTFNCPPTPPTPRPQPTFPAYPH